MSLKYFCKDRSWRVDITNGDLYCDGELCSMTPGATRVVHYLVNHPNTDCSYTALYEAMSGDTEAIGDPNTAIYDIFRHEIAKKCPIFQENKNSKDVVKKIRGQGIRFIPTDDVVFRFSIDRDITKGSGGVAPCEHYCGRERDLQMLRQNAFLESSLLVLSGEPGIGKSELARAFIKMCMGDDIPARLCYRKVLWVSFDRDLKTTIENLPCDSIPRANAFESRIDALRALPGPKLLVIDNVDSITKEDLGFESAALRDLFSTDCHILMTSKVNLEGYHPALRQYVVKPIDPDSLTQLFLRKSKWIDESQADQIKDLIERYLCCNTYLTVLAAGVAQLNYWTDVSEIKSHFHSLNVAQMQGSRVTAPKDGMLSEHLPLFEHFCRLFGLVKPKLDARQKIVLLHLALLPVGGLPIKWFVSHAFDSSQPDRIHNDIRLLANHYFCFVEQQSGEPWIRIQPMLREVILRDNWGDSEDRHFKTYLTSLVRKLDRSYYHPETPQALQASTAAAAGLRIMREKVLLGEKVPLYTQLLCQITSVFDIVKNYSAVREYADEAGKWLDKIRPQTWTLEGNRGDILLYLTACNNLAYPLVHTGELERSREYFTKAIGLIKGLNREKLLEDTELSVKVSKIYNNLGASFSKAKQHEKALAIHQEMLTFRQALAAKSITDSEALLAASYKAVGTDLFYLERFGEAFLHHEKAVSLYQDALGQDSLEYVTALNRMIGAGIRSEDREMLYGEWMEKLYRGFRYLCSIEFVEEEVCNCLKNGSDLVRLQPALRGAGAKLLESAGALPEKATGLPNVADAIRVLKDT